MNKTKSIGANVAYNLVFQVLNLVLPLITTPYLSRVLGSAGIGTYSYTNSIVQYFVLFGSVGLSLYGTRQVAYAREDKKKLSETFWNLYAFRALASGIALGLYLLIFSVIDTVYRPYLYCQGILIVSNMIDITWLFAGLEDFKKIVIRSIAVRLLGVLLIFLLVKTPEDIWKYIVIYSGTILMGNAMLWTYVPRTVGRAKPSWAAMRQHLYPAVAMFLPQLAIELYVIFDKTMLGFLSNVHEVGFYTQAETISKIPLSLIAVISTVMLPRMSNLFENKMHDEIHRHLNKNMQIVLLFSIGAAFGVAGIANELIPWLLGPGYEESIPLLIMLAPLTLLIGISNVIGRQYLIPSNRIKAFTVAVICGTCINFFLNLLLIPFYAARGACIATLVAELMVAVIQWAAVRKHVNIKEHALRLAKYLGMGAVMYAIVRLIGLNMGVGMLTTTVQCAAGGLVYMTGLYLLKDEALVQLERTIAAKMIKKQSKTEQMILKPLAGIGKTADK